jgi:hypothetical protein
MRAAVPMRTTLALSCLLLSCAGARQSGLTAADVSRSEVLPSGYVSAGTASAECGAVPAWEEISGEPVGSFDCSENELHRELAEQAALAGADVLAGVECRESATRGVACSATMARPKVAGLSKPRAAGAPGGVTSGDELSFELRRRIEVDVEPARESFARKRRPASAVGEARLLPVSHVELGSIRARCEPEACAARDLRVALRVAAGGLGVSDLVGVSCVTLDGERQCLATLAASELDPETVPSAR